MFIELILNHTLITPLSINIKLHKRLAFLCHGQLKKLFFEGKTLELIAHGLSQLTSDKRKPHSNIFEHLFLPPDFVHKVRDLLIRIMQDLPCNFTKEFKKYFGTSPRDHLCV